MTTKHQLKRLASVPAAPPKANLTTKAAKKLAASLAPVPDSLQLLRSHRAGSQGGWRACDYTRVAVELASHGHYWEAMRWYGFAESRVVMEGP